MWLKRWSLWMKFFSANIKKKNSCWAVLLCGIVWYAVRGNSKVWVWIKSFSTTIQMKAIIYLFTM